MSSRAPAVCLGCGRRGLAEACVRCGTPRVDATWTKQPAPRVRLFVAGSALSALALFLLLVAIDLLRTVAREDGATAGRWAMVLLFVVAIGGLGLWSGRGGVAALVNAFATHWQVVGEGGAVAGLVSTLVGFVVGGGVVCAVTVRKARPAGVTTPGLERVGARQLLRALKDQRGIEGDASLALVATLAGATEVALVDVHIATLRAWSKAGALSPRKEAPTTRTLLLERTRAPSAGAPPREAAFADALSALGTMFTDKSRFALADVVHELGSRGTDLSLREPTGEAALDSDTRTQADTAALAAFCTDIELHALRFDAVPVQLDVVLAKAMAVSGHGPT